MGETDEEIAAWNELTPEQQAAWMHAVDPDEEGGGADYPEIDGGDFAEVDE